MFIEFVIPISLAVMSTMIIWSFTSQSKFKQTLPFALILNIMFGAGIFVWNSAISICIERFTNSHGGEEVFVSESYDPLIISNYWFTLPIAIIIILLFLNHFVVYNKK